MKKIGNTVFGTKYSVLSAGNSFLFRIVTIALLLLSTGLFAQVQLTARVSKTTLGENQRFRLEYQINKQGGDDFKLPNFKNFKVLQGPSQSVSQSWVNGKSSYTLKYSYILKPIGKGVFTIPPATIEYDGKIISSNQVTIKVVDAVELPKDPNDPNYVASQNVHLISTISNSSPYVGESVYVEYRLYIKDVSVGNYQVNEIGNFEGFWSHDLSDKNVKAKQGEYKGEPYQYFTLKKAVLIPQRSGNLYVNPMDVDLTVGVPTGRGDFWGNMITRNVQQNFQSKKKVVKVKALPAAGKPLDFTGAVGNFDFTVKATRNVLKSNESAQVKVKVSGKGNLKLFNLPKIEAPQELEIYDPEHKEKVNTYSSGSKGNIEDSYTVVPQYKGKFKIPEVSFSYFNPKDKQYHTITSDDIIIDVLDGKPLITNSDESGFVNKQKIAQNNKDFRFIQTNTNLQPINKNYFYKSTAFYIWLVLCMVLIPLGWAVSKKQREASKDVAKNKSKKADKLTKKYLSTAKKELGNKATFYEALEKALHNYLKAKLKVETTDISKDRIVSLLKSKKASDENISQFIKVFENCEMARYSQLSNDQMEQDFTLAQKAITDLDKNI